MVVPVPPTSGISGRNRALVELLHRRGPGPFTPADAARIWGVAPAIAGRRLASFASRGWLTRPTRGLYLPVPLDAARSGEWTEDPWLVASKLFPEGYLGGWTACEHWGLTEQAFRRLLVFTPSRRSRSLDLADAPIQVRVIRRVRLFGLTGVWRRSVQVMVSDPSRTVVDLLDDPATGGGIRHVADVVEEYFAGTHRDDSRLLDYAEKLGNRTVYKRLGWLLEARGIEADALVASAHARISTGITRLDPARAASGQVSNRWRLRINADASG